MPAAYYSYDTYRKGGTAMPLWLEWVGRHWLGFVLLAGLAASIAYVSVKHKQLFYKE